MVWKRCDGNEASRDIGDESAKGGVSRAKGNEHTEFTSLVFGRDEVLFLSQSVTSSWAVSVDGRCFGEGLNGRHRSNAT